jgi:hypothetical protein
MADDPDLPTPKREDWSATMTTTKELQARIDQANQLLKQKLPPKDRMRVANLRLLDQTRLSLREKFPELDQPDVAH